MIHDDDRTSAAQHFGKLISAIPLQVTLKGTTNVQSYAISYLMEVLDTSALRDLLNELKTIDWDTFEDVDVNAETYEFSDIVETTDRPTRRPTRRPVEVFKTKFIPVQCILNDLPSKYNLSVKELIQTQLIRYVMEVLEDHLDSRLELIKVEFGGYLGNRKPNKNTVSVPLRIVIKGPEDILDFAGTMLMELIEEYERDIVNKLMGDDFATFKDVYISTSTYDFDAIVDETSDPTPRPTRKPTRKPTRSPVVAMVKSVHPVQLKFKNVDKDYELSSSDIAAIVGFAREVLEEHLDDTFKLVSPKVVYTGNGSGQGLKSFPLSVTVRGPRDSRDYALAYIMSALEDNMVDIVRMCKELDDAFKGSTIVTESYDPATVADDFILKSTSHDVKVTFDGVPKSYRLSAAHRESIIDYIEELLRDHLDDPVKLVAVAAESYSKGPALPLLVTVKAPDRIAYRIAYIMEVLDNFDKDIAMFMKALDWNTFKDVSISSSPYDPSILDEDEFDEDEAITIEESSHYVELTLDGVPAGYKLPASDRIAIIQYLEELLDEHLEGIYGNYNDVSIAYAGERRRLSSHQDSRRLDSISLPRIAY